MTVITEYSVTSIRERCLAAASVRTSGRVVLVDLAGQQKRKKQRDKSLQVEQWCSTKFSLRQNRNLFWRLGQLNRQTIRILEVDAIVWSDDAWFKSFSLEFGFAAIDVVTIDRITIVIHLSFFAFE